jgi:hypothetical protein
LACAVTAAWAGKHVGLHFIPPSQPWRNGCVESFNSRVRDECNINTFWSVTQARVVITDWKHDYNHHRGSLGKFRRTIALFLFNALLLCTAGVVHVGVSIWCVVRLAVLGYLCDTEQERPRSPTRRSFAVGLSAVPTQFTESNNHEQPAERQ